MNIQQITDISHHAAESGMEYINRKCRVLDSPQEIALASMNAVLLMVSALLTAMAKSHPDGMEVVKRQLAVLEKEIQENLK